MSNSNLNLICNICDKSFQRKRSVHQHSINRSGENYKPTCSRECARKIKTKSICFTLICGECNSAFERKTNSENKNCFCSRHCSTIFNNKKRKKSLPEKVEKTLKYTGVTKKELFETSKNYFSARCSIQKNARLNFNKSKKEQICSICSYDKHIQVCHIKSVSSFNDNDLIIKINDIENLIALCPNHHWEYDNGLLTL
jgi:hypothetical protein